MECRGTRIMKLERLVYKPSHTSQGKIECLYILLTQKTAQIVESYLRWTFRATRNFFIFNTGDLWIYIEASCWSWGAQLTNTYIFTAGKLIYQRSSDLAMEQIYILTECMAIFIDGNHKHDFVRKNGDQRREMLQIVWWLVIWKVRPVISRGSEFAESWSLFFARLACVQASTPWPWNTAGMLRWRTAVGWI